MGWIKGNSGFHKVSGDTSCRHESEGEAALWASILYTYVTDMRFAKNMAQVKKLLWDLSDPWTENICTFLGVDYDAFREHIEGIAQSRLDLGKIERSKQADSLADSVIQH